MATRDLLFEILTEELPPRSLESLSIALAQAFAAALDAAGITYRRLRRFATPRRLALLAERLPERQPDRPIERRGPPRSAAFDASGQPTQAALAFARSCGVAVGELIELRTDKGVWLGYRGVEPGAPTVTLLGGIAARAVAALPAPKRMRWGAGEVEFVRPVHRVVLLFGAEVVECTILGIAAGNETFGHRFHAPRPIRLRTPRAYPGALRRAKVIADFDERRQRILAGVAAAAERAGGRALIDATLLDEVTALVEWPVPIAGRFEERYLRLPREVIVATVQDHQRYFPVETPDGALSAAFITVANLESRDPDKVREGNERVVRPRLADAEFFWEQDRKRGLEACAARLGGIIFQAKLGSYADKTGRVRALAVEIGAGLGAGEAAGRAARLAKADLMTAMVGEFPELQGTMGRYYALAAGEDPAVADAIEEQYRPRFAGDALPRTRAGQALALADKIDTLAGIFAIGQRPSGAKDPFGLRRAALGVLRILLETPLDMDLTGLVERAAAAQPVTRPDCVEEVIAFIAERLRGLLAERVAGSSSET
ncbi:MAG TPA: glycine--tRNA ligase subunit beta, partial [Steroidobacteraceae bacterium]|nr:glycine--tRNA ligase subunit beta [Steroidobacteraceae bacterium]